MSATLEQQQYEVYRLRMEEQQSFDEIAAALRCGREEVLRSYVQACKIAKQSIKQERA